MPRIDGGDVVETKEILVDVLESYNKKLYWHHSDLYRSTTISIRINHNLQMKCSYRKS